MTRERALYRLFTVWGIMILVPTLILTAQTIAGKYGADSDQAWTWLLIQISPVLAILLAASFSNPSKAWRNGIVSTFRWRCALSVSILQGVAILVVLFIEPLVEIDQFALFSQTLIFLTLLNGVVVAAVGAVVFDGR